LPSRIEGRGLAAPLIEVSWMVCQYSTRSLVSTEKHETTPRDRNAGVRWSQGMASQAPAAETGRLVGELKAQGYDESEH
jgi:hypothetical protein